MDWFDILVVYSWITPDDSTLRSCWQRSVPDENETFEQPFTAVGYNIHILHPALTTECVPE